MTVVSLDIETDTSPLTESEKAAGYTARGLDPRITEITAISLATESETLVFDDAPERELLHVTFDILQTMNPSLLVTWNGAVFDLPFIADRSKVYDLQTDLALVPDPALVPKYEPTPGHAGGYAATWGRAVHLDVAYLVKDDAERRGVKWSLKPYARSIGLTPVEVDRERMHLLTPEQLREYAASDAVVTRQIAKSVLHFA